MKKNRRTEWIEKLDKLIEQEIYLATGVKSTVHWSGDCKMNEIHDLVDEIIEKSKKEP